MNVDPSTLDAKAVAVYAEQAKDQGVVAFLLDVIPGSVIGAFASGNILQVLLFAVLFGFALHRLGSKGQLIFNVIESFSQVIFGIINMIMRLAPIGAFGAMAFTIGKYGVGTLVQLGQLIICFYITCILFVVVVLGSIARATGFSIFKFIRYIREELLIVLGTSSQNRRCRVCSTRWKSWAAVSRWWAGDPDGLLLQPRRHLDIPDDGGGVYRSGDQQPYGYFPSDHPAGGAPALLERRGGRDGQWLYRAGGDHFCGGHLPVAGLALILGIDRFMSEARALTNLVGNGVATVVVAKWVKELDHKKLDDTLNNRSTDSKILAYPLNLVTNARIPLSGCGLLRIITVHTCHNSTRFFWVYFTSDRDVLPNARSNRRVFIVIFKSEARRETLFLTRNVDQGFTCRAQKFDS
jgi:aerobic C4-dicarboxylate transport protein